MSRYTRDEIITQGLELASSPTLSQHDAPGGIVDSEAYSIKWLQNALDMFHRKYPFSSDIQDIAIVIPASSSDIYITPGVYLPTDFMLDVKHGVLVTVNSISNRLTRKSFQYFLNLDLNNQSNTASEPRFYCVRNNRIKITPRVTESLSGILYYYALPSKLEANDIVPFPDESILIEFICMKALEWTRLVDRGTAQVFLQKQLAGLRASGLLNEPEYEDGIPLENNQRLSDSSSGWSWMGPTAY